MPSTMLKKHLFLILFLISLSAVSQTTQKTTIMHLKVQDDIDARTNRYTELGFEKATELQADYIILELDTYGGALDYADEIRTRILNFETPVYAFINKDAASAGALISIACDSIYMAQGSSIGAATVVTQDGDAAPDKYQSYMRSIMRSTAEATGRNPHIAEGMVDEDIDLDSIAQEGKVVTFSVSEAIKYGFCEAQVKNIDEIMARSGITNYETITFELSSADRIIAFFLNPYISGVLILIILGGIYFEFQTPGVGFPILASIIATILYFTPYYLNGLAENWEIISFFIGIMLIAAEIFIIPGFGIAGISGIIITLGSLVLVMLNNDNFDFSFVHTDDIFISLTTAVAGMAGSIVLMIVGGVQLTNSKAFQRIALQGTQDKNEGFTSSFYTEKSLVGKKGTAHTVLRPSGKIEIDGEILDAYTRGNFLEKGTPVEVISDEGTSLKVKEIQE